MGRKGAVPFGGGRAGSPSNTMWPGPRPTCMPSFILIRQTVWPQNTNVTDRQDRTDRHDRQWSDSIGRTDLQTVAQKRFAVYAIGTVCNIGVLWPNGSIWTKVPLGMDVGLIPGHILLDRDPALPQRGTASNFRPMSVVAKWLE